MRPYGIELRERIVTAYDNREGSIRELAERFVVAVGTVQSYLKLARTKGDLTPRPHAGGTAPLIDEAGLEHVRLLVHEKPDATEADLAEVFSRHQGVEVSRQTIGRALQRLGLTRKKNSSR